ncbi:DUF4142 domain-containing protein [Pedobacter namyangjuensis]|uniref:DUF4142 domain-containing protein n=1 Tax=Pedobacter namyangjuensis TaxID=600626 RepID=UPI0013B3CF86|nr:DUF4142 domain-containing protein [Pedobacter namyangjuensis]
MNKKLLFAAMALGATVYACNPKPSTSSQNDTTQIAKDPVDTALVGAPNSSEFAAQAAIGGMTEVESSAKMIKRTENPEIQTMAVMMVKDHGAANAELKAIAKKEKMNLPQALPQEKLQAIADIESMSEEAQNLAYAELMVREHEQAVSMFSSAGQSEPNPALKAFASKHLPTLKAHLAHAQSVLKNLSGAAKKSGTGKSE